MRKPSGGRCFIPPLPVLTSPATANGASSGRRASRAANFAVRGALRFCADSMGASRLCSSPDRTQARLPSLAGTIIIAAKAGRLPSASSNPIEGRSIMQDSASRRRRIEKYGRPRRRRRRFHPIGNRSAISPPICASATRSARARIRGRGGRRAAANSVD